MITRGPDAGFIPAIRPNHSVTGPQHVRNPRHNENVQESLGTRTLKDGSVHRMRGRALQIGPFHRHVFSRMPSLIEPILRENMENRPNFRKKRRKIRTLVGCVTSRGAGVWALKPAYPNTWRHHPEGEASDVGLEGPQWLGRQCHMPSACVGLGFVFKRVSSQGTHAGAIGWHAYAIRMRGLGTACKLQPGASRSCKWHLHACAWYWHSL
jgi:hypothetical protein